MEFRLEILVDDIDAATCLFKAIEKSYFEKRILKYFDIIKKIVF